MNDRGFGRVARRVRKFPMYYVIGSYLLFVIINIRLLHMEDPYGEAMIVIGLLWLGVINTPK
jgi:hypothetical protein